MSFDPVSALLRPAGAAYGAVMRLRERVVRPAGLGLPVASVGNLTLGGTGKTPIVLSLARRFRDQGLRVAILSRGYRRRSRGLVVVADFERLRVGVEEAGDEPYLLARELEGVAVVVCSSRRLAGQHAERELQADLVILDDGYQHLQLARDLDILVVDATESLEPGRCLPAGRLREPLHAIARAHLVMVTRSHHPHDAVGLRRLVRRFNPSAPIVSTRQTIRGLRWSSGQETSLQALEGRPVAVVSGIGRPEQFEADVRGLGLEVRAALRHRDHHSYTRSDVDRLRALMTRSGAAAILTTTKDLVRLERQPVRDLPIAALLIEVQPGDSPELGAVLNRVPGDRLRSRS